MAQPPPLDPYWNLSEVSLLRRILTNLNDWIANGGGGGSGLPSQVGHAGEFLTTNGTSASWAAAAAANTAYATATTNNTGNTTITPTKAIQSTKLAFTGVASSRIIILDVAGRASGDKLFLDLVFPATAAIVISVRNATSGGTLLLPAEVFATQDFTTDGVTLSAHWEFTFNGTAWIYDSSSIPA